MGIDVVTHREEAFRVALVVTVSSRLVPKTGLDGVDTDKNNGGPGDDRRKELAENFRRQEVKAGFENDAQTRSSENCSISSKTGQFCAIRWGLGRLRFDRTAPELSVLPE